jgi:hypothetical protein
MRRTYWSFSAEQRFGRALIAGLAALIGCGSQRPTDERLLVLGGECFGIPAASLVYFDAAAPRFATLAFANDAVRASVPGYSIPNALASGMRDTFYVGVSRPTDSEAAALLANEAAERARSQFDLWYGIGAFANRIVEPIGGTSLFRVRPLAGGPTWVVVSRAPDPATRDTHLARDFWLANCAGIEPGRVDRCVARVDHANLRMTMYTTEANLAVREPLAQYVVDALARWRTECPVSD